MQSLLEFIIRDHLSGVCLPDAFTRLFASVLLLAINVLLSLVTLFVLHRFPYIFPVWPSFASFTHPVKRSMNDMIGGTIHPD